MDGAGHPKASRTVVALLARLDRSDIAAELIARTPDEASRAELASVVTGAIFAAAREHAEGAADARTSLCLAAFEREAVDDAFRTVEHLDLSPDSNGSAALSELILLLAARGAARQAHGLVWRLPPPRLTPFRFTLRGPCREGHVKDAVAGYESVEDRLDVIQDADVMEERAPRAHGRPRCRVHRRSPR